jgi:dolichol-phosphate mannosyltransferase
MVAFDLSIVVPTYNEKENVRELIKRLENEFRNKKISGEIIFVDDNSQDGTGKLLDSISKEKKNVRVIHRDAKLGLSSAVIEGWKLSSGKVIGVMDADLSHPPEKVGELYRAILCGADIAIGSRYIRGGSIVGWGFFRKISSKFAGLLALPITKIRDPMSGFFLIRKDRLDLKKINSKGFKILLEILFESGKVKIKEIPITFIDRKFGKSKASAKELFLYLSNLKKYYLEKLKKFARFSLVGIFGTILNLAVLYFFTEIIGAHYIISGTIAFFIATVHNYIFNKIWTFEEELHRNFKIKYLKFIVTSIFSLMINLLVLYFLVDYLHIYYILSQLIAILAGSVSNYLLNQRWTFK